MMDESLFGLFLGCAGIGGEMRGANVGQVGRKTILGSDRMCWTEKILRGDWVAKIHGGSDRVCSAGHIEV